MVPGSTDFERETQDIYILSNLYLQKWIVDFHSQQELVAEMNLNGIISGQVDIGDFEILDMDFGKQNRLVFLLLEVNTGRHSLVICQESVQVDTLEILAVKNLTMAFEGENAGNLSLCNGGPVALVSFPNRLYVKYIFDESDFEQVIPLKKSDLVGCSVDRSRVDLESIDSKSISAICCLGTGVMDVHVNIINLVRSVRKNEILQTGKVQDEFYVKLEQAIFFSNSEDEINPIFFDLGDIPSQIDDQCIELAYSILRGKNSLLKNTLDESEYLADALTRLENIPKVLRQREILNSVSRSTLEELMSAIEKLEVLKAWREHHNSIYK